MGVRDPSSEAKVGDAEHSKSGAEIGDGSPKGFEYLAGLVGEGRDIALDRRTGDLLVA